MNQVLTIQLTPAELKAMILEALQEHDAAKAGADISQKLYSRNQAAKSLGISHASVCILVNTGHLAVTPDGKKIIGKSIMKFAQKRN